MFRCLSSARTIDYNLITYNMIMALGHVAVALKDTPDTSYSILQFFVQIFCRRPSEVDVLIVDQMGCMVLARSEVRTGGGHRILRIYCRDAGTIADECS